ncbi:hypothetical protein [Actinomadura madurae]|uniref:hypothetical protein n=1 Tax=Actinomadura madurae TaxID=1993 RepID=UPI000D91467E|nr:hypothetical protein [Actinomadura madurae]SPT57094.1 Uncharacterised protein [Actinomadura madurae]
MSFDLWVWREEQPVTTDLALHKYRWLTSEEEWSGPEPEMVVDDRVGAFHTEILSVYPRLEDIAEGESPWSLSPSLVPDNYVAMCMGHSAARDAGPVIVETAMRHGLVCFDPQVVRVHNPPEIVDSDGPHLVFFDGGTVNEPRSEDLPRLLRQIDDKNWFACLDVRPGWYVQVGLGRRAGGAPDGMYGVEYREGSADRHFRHVTDDFDKVVNAFQGFAGGGEDWKADFTKYDPS